MRKRICSMLLSLVMLVALFPTALGADAVTIDPNVNMGTATPAQSAYFSSAYVRNKGGTSTSNGTARSIEAVVNLKNYGGKHTIYTTVMKRTDYNKYAADLVNGIQSGGYFKLGNVADTLRYAIGRASPLNDGSTAALPLVEASTANDSTLGSGGTVANKTMPAATISGQHYFDEYALVVFSEDATTGNSYYYVDFFYIDADGYVATPSYLVRYNDNNPAQGTGSVSGTPARTIQRAVEKTGVPGATTLSAAEPVRVGYTFQGWSSTAAGAVEYGKGASFPQPSPLYKAYDLYAVWKNIPIQFETITGSKNQTITDEVRVGVSGTWAFKLDSASDSRSTKTYTVTQITVKGTPVTDAVKYPGNIPAGLSIRPDGNMGWTLSGTPKYDCTDPIVMTVKVTDVANATTDEMQLTIPQIKRGLQPVPDLTVTTGLSTTMVDDADESTNDGRLIGFYAIGQPSKADSANASMTDGTGTYTNYYLTKGMIYEYRPVGDVDALWREIPAPEKLYSGLTPEQKTAFLASLEAGAITRYKTTITSKTAATCEAQPDGTAWDDAYGAIRFVDGAPVVTGLAKDAVYEVRFRESDTFDASTAVTITVGGSSSGGGPSGYALVFNFAGGGVEVDELPLFATQEGLNNTTVTLPEAVPTRENCTFDGWLDNRSGTLYQPGEEVEITDGSVSLSAKWTATTEGFVSITFYDWDETTVLGSIVVPKGADASAEVAEFVKSLMADGSRDKAILNGADNEALPCFVDDPAFPLSYKRGYSFYGWLPYDSELYTNCGKALTGDNEIIDLATPRLSSEIDEVSGDTLPQQSQNFLDLEENVIVKSCYKDNAELYFNEEMLYENTYTVEVSENNRIEFTGTYTVSVRIKREKNVDGQIVGVPRLFEPTLRAVYNGTIYNFFSIGSKDEEAFTVYPAATIDNLEFLLVDFYRTKNKVTASTKSNYVNETSGTTATDPAGFRHKGTIGRINDVLASGDLTSLNAGVLKAQAGLTYTNLNEAKGSLRKGWLNKNSENGTEETLYPESQWLGLTFEEMNYAIANGGILPEKP